MNDRTPLISVIVPVYKVEEYLEKCLDSILAQTYKNLEIILVDDGSPDNCGKICDAYAEKDARIKVIHKENGGLSDARNAGLDVATGKYVGFVDSDDTIMPTMYEELLKKMLETESDLVSCAFTRVYSTNDVSAPDAEIQSLSFDSESALRAMLHRNPFGAHSWCKLYRMDLIDSLRFDTAIRNSEDIPFVAEYILRCKKVTFFERHLYNYLQRRGSILNSNFTDRHMTIYDAHKKVIDIAKSANLSDKTLASAQAATIMSCIRMAYELVPQKDAARKFIPTIKKNLRRHISRSSLAQLHRSRQVQAVLLSISFLLFKAFFKLSKAKITK